MAGGGRFRPQNTFLIWKWKRDGIQLLIVHRYKSKCRWIESAVLQYCALLVAGLTGTFDPIRYRVIFNSGSMWSLSAPLTEQILSLSAGHHPPLVLASLPAGQSIHLEEWGVCVSEWYQSITLQICKHRLLPNTSLLGIFSTLPLPHGNPSPFSSCCSGLSPSME